MPLRQLALFGGRRRVLVVLFAIAEPYRRARLMTFLDPWADAGGAGFQSVQGQIALGSGGLFGVGLGESRAEESFLPEAHTDFILAIDRRGAGRRRDLRRAVPLRDDRLRRAAGGQGARGTYAKLLAAGHHVAVPLARRR